MSGGEFDLIAEHLRPLTHGAPGAFSLLDDVAETPADARIVTKDLLIEGVHFRADDPLGVVARKALRVNLSDLAAKGARPLGYLLGCAWPAGVEAADIAAFASGLRADQDAFGVALWGGDTTVHRRKGAPFTISITCFGAAPETGIVRRAGAAEGDDLYVTGAIGDAFLGLRVLAGEIAVGGAHDAYLADRYRLPRPRLAVGAGLVGLATAALDVSDGLLADCGHLTRAAAAPLDARIRLDAIPLSEAARAWVDAQDDRAAARARLAAGGDDYEILFAAPAHARDRIAALAEATGVAITRCGAMGPCAGAHSTVTLIDANGAPVSVEAGGYDHFQR